jgi:hypothetical protein
LLALAIGVLGIRCGTCCGALAILRSAVRAHGLRLPASLDRQQS